MKPGLESIKNIIAVASGKGGVGKSTVTTNLAFALKEQGFKVGVIDGDIYGPSQPGLLGSDDKPTGQGGFIVPVEKDGVKFISMGVMNPSGKAVIMRAPLAIRALSQFLSGVLWGEMDYLLIDLPPGTGDIQLTLSQQARLTGAVVVTTPQRVALDISKNAVEMFKTVNVPILGVVENMSGFACKNCGENTPIFKTGGGENLATKESVPFLGCIPLDPEIMASGDEGVNLIAHHKSAGPAKAFVDLANKVIESQKEAKSETSEPKGIDVVNGKLEVKWDENDSTSFETFDLRFACPCANCVDENTGVQMLTPESIATDISVVRHQLVGRYGMSIHFSDGHNTGIYKFSKLKELKNGTRQDSFSV